MLESFLTEVDHVSPEGQRSGEILNRRMQLGKMSVSKEWS